MAASGNVVWPSASEPLWRFTWSLADSPDMEGIVISNAFYRGHLVLYKGSLPSLRVQYDGGGPNGQPCGPYKDPLTYGNTEPTTRCPGSRVCVYSYVSAGLRALCVEAYHRIGAYRLTDRWVFWEHGHLYPRLYSAGLQCNSNHRHHAYWRLDFDIDGAANDAVLEYNSYTSNQGWGNGWHLESTETTRVKSAASHRSWAVLDKSSGRGYHILPGPHDGVADAFSNRDLWVLRYHSGEDKHGNQGSAASDALQPYVDGENIDGQDVTIWYCGHLSHEAHAGGDEWHHLGPSLMPFGNWT